MVVCSYLPVSHQRVHVFEARRGVGVGRSDALLIVTCHWCSSFGFVRRFPLIQGAGQGAEMALARGCDAIVDAMMRLQYCDD